MEAPVTKSQVIRYLKYTIYEINLIILQAYNWLKKNPIFTPTY